MQKQGLYNSIDYTGGSGVGSVERKGEKQMYSPLMSSGNLRAEREGPLVGLPKRGKNAMGD